MTRRIYKGQHIAASGTEVLRDGTLAVDLATNSLYIHDGTTPGGALLSGGGGGGISNVVEDTTPQLGGNLDVNGFSITDSVGGFAGGVVRVGPTIDINSNRVFYRPGTDSGLNIRSDNTSNNIYLYSYGDGNGVGVGNVYITATGVDIYSNWQEGGAGELKWSFDQDGTLTTPGTLLVNTIEGNGEAGVTRLLLQATGNGNAYLSIPTNDASTTTNLVIGNEARAIQLVGAVVLDGEIFDPNLTGGSNVTPTNIPLTRGYVILNEGAGGLGYFNLPDGQEGQIIQLVMGSTDSLLASQIHVIMASGRYLFDAEGGGQQVYTGPIDVQPFTEIPTAMVTMMYAGGYWTVTHGTVTND